MICDGTPSAPSDLISFLKGALGHRPLHLASTSYELAAASAVDLKVKKEFIQDQICLWSTKHMSLLAEATGARKKSKASETQEMQEDLIPSLPNEIALDCLARVPRSYHSSLSQVSKSIRSLLSSPVFYDTHTTIYGKQTMLYFSVNYPDSNHVQWFMVNPDNPGLVLRLPLIPSPTFRPSAMCALLGHDIYVIGGYSGDALSAEVWILDCRFNRWRQGPTMRNPRDKGGADVIDGKVYVVGETWQKSSILGEVLDPVVGSWKEIKIIHGSNGSDHESLMSDRVKKLLALTGYGIRPTMIDRVLYSFVDNPVPMLVGHELSRVERTWVRKIVKDSLFLVPQGMKAVMVKTVAEDLFLLWIHPKSMKPPELNENFVDICCRRVQVKKIEDGQLHAIASDEGYSKFYSYNFITDGCSIQKCFAVEI